MRAKSNQIQTLIDLGADRVLTSGQATSAEKGIELLKELQEMARNHLIIMPGGGINAENVHLFKKHNFKEIHASATELLQTVDAPKISMNSKKFLNDTHIAVSDIEKINQLIKSIQS